jgi:hypothetical protein
MKSHSHERNVPGRISWRISVKQSQSVKGPVIPISEKLVKIFKYETKEVSHYFMKGAISELSVIKNIFDNNIL